MIDLSSRYISTSFSEHFPLSPDKMLPLLRTLSGPVSLRTIPQLCGHVVPNGSLHRVTTNLQAFRQLATKPKEVFRKDFLNKRYVPKVPPKKVKVVEEGDAFIQFISQAFKVRARIILHNSKICSLFKKKCVKK